MPWLEMSLNLGNQGSHTLKVAQQQHVASRVRLFNIKVTDIS